MIAVSMLVVEAETEHGCFDVGLGAEEVGLRELDPGSGAALLRAVAGVPSRRRPGPDVTIRRVLVDGEDVTTKPPRERRLGYVPARGGLLPHLTVRENILDGRGAYLTAQTAEGKADRLAGKLHLTASLTLLPHELLSEEQRVRVSLARAAMGEPPARIVHLPSLPKTKGVGVDPQRLHDLLSNKVALYETSAAPATLVLTDALDLLNQFRDRP